MAEIRVAHADAATTFSQIDDALAQARQGLQRMQDTATQLTSAAWLGSASSKFGANWQALTDEFNALHNLQLQLVEHGRHSLNAHAQLDTDV